MNSRSLVLASLRYYWRTHLAVVAGVAVAVSVLAGALLVGDSVRASLRQIVNERLGRTAVAIAGQGFFRDALDESIAGQDGFDEHFGEAAALIALEGAIVHEPSGSAAGGVLVYGVDAAFFRLHGHDSQRAPRNRQALLSPALGAELGAGVNDALLLRVQKPSAIPASTLQGRRTDTSRAVRLTVRETLPASGLGDFSIRPGQDAVRAVFVPIARLQRDLDLEGRANLLLLSARAGAPDRPAALTGTADELLAASATFEDLGLQLRRLPERHALSLESETGLLTGELLDTAATVAGRLGYRTTPILTYLANTIRVGDREIPYSVVTGLDLDEYGRSGDRIAPPAVTSQSSAVNPESSIHLNAWAAEELAPRPGETVTLEYFLWSDEEGLSTHTTEFAYAGSVPMEGAGSDRTLTPEYPGLTDANRMGDWDPPFPVDLGRIRPRDEAYWDAHRAAPKAFVPLGTARDLWSSRYGTATSLRLYVPDGESLEEAGDALTAGIRREYGPAAAGLAVQPVRAQAIAASRGATNFGEYFLYFSFFIVVSGLLLTGLFFKLGIEQRVREVGLLSALGFTRARVRRVLLAEGVLLAVAGAALGLAGAVAFSALILHGLRTWWVDAVGTTRLALAVHPATLGAGAAAGIAIAVVTLAAALRRLGTSAPRDLLSGLALMADAGSGGGRFLRAAPALARPSVRLVLGLLAAAVLIGAATANLIGDAPAFFGAGGVLLLASLAAVSAWLRDGRTDVHGHGQVALFRLGIRQATARPGRSVLSIALIAFATFVIVAVGAFRRGAPADPYDPGSGTGGFALFAESAAPVMYDLESPDGRVDLGIPPDDEVLRDVKVERFRLRPGEDSSCLNLYRPTSPRLVAPTDAFVASGGFRFAASLAATGAERSNPWLLLERTFPDGAIPTIGDANSLQYVLHASVGSDLVIPGPDGEPLVLRVVAALSDSLFQSELIIPERHFSRLFPRLEGYRFFLIAPPPDREAEVAARLEDALADYGFDAQSSAERLAAYHRVENTYLSTFQTLGGLGLLLGTLGLGAVLLRNVLERRRELALLQAVGYRSPALRTMVIAESLLLLFSGVAIGTASALLAIVPALAGRGAEFPAGGTLLVIAAVIASGLIASAAATRAAARSPLLQSLRSE